MHLVGVAVVAC